MLNDMICLFWCIMQHYSTDTSDICGRLEKTA